MNKTIKTAPPLLVGLTESGSRVEVRTHEDGGYDIVVDGTVERHEAVPWELDPDMIEPLRVGEHTCREVFDAPEEALDALKSFVASRETEPPWKWSEVLYRDGLVDANFSLTPRGLRALRGTPERQPFQEDLRGPTFGVLIADAARARVFVLAAPGGKRAPTLEPLTEVAQSTRPEARARASEVMSDSRPGLRREGSHGPRHAVSDRRENHRLEEDKRFASEVSDEAARLWRKHGVTQAILVASHTMLSALRPSLTRLKEGPAPWTLKELARDLTRLSGPAIHDALFTAGLLPERGRQPARKRTPGQPAS